MLLCKMRCDICNTQFELEEPPKTERRYVDLSLHRQQGGMILESSRLEMGFCIRCLEILKTDNLCNILANGVMDTVRQMEHEKKTDAQG